MKKKTYFITKLIFISLNILCFSLLYSNAANAGACAYYEYEDPDTTHLNELPCYKEYDTHGFTPPEIIYSSSSNGMSYRIYHASQTTSHSNWNWPQVAIIVDDLTGYVVVGGGGWADYTGPGALLTESRPAFDPWTVNPDVGTPSTYTGWVASSKDHKYVNPHTLHVYAIAIKLDGVSATSLKNYITITRYKGSQNKWPNATVSGASNQTLISGGGRINWYSINPNGGNLLTDSYPIGNQWYVAGKDHIVSSQGKAEAYAISIATSIPGWGNLAIQKFSPTTGFSNHGVATANLTLNNGYWVTGIGGKSVWTGGVGRLVFKMQPTNNTTLQVENKDHGYQSGTSVSGYAIGIKKQ